MKQKKYHLRKISQKGLQIKSQYHKLCYDIDRALLEEYGYIPCRSCGIRLTDSGGNAVRPWGHAHNLSVGQYPKFQLIPGNVAPRCQDFGNYKGCHEKLDSGNIVKIMSLNDFKELLEYRRLNCPEAYNLWLIKMEEL